jgi:preprotein translocase subunit SecG
MTTFLMLIHIAVCLVLIMVVLLQSGKAADLAGAFGGGGSQTALGSRGAATFLTKATTTAAVLFMITSLGLALLGSRQTGSVLETTPVSAPAAPAAPVPGPAGAEGSALPGSTGGEDAAKQEGTSGQAAAPTKGSESGKPGTTPDKPK